jgi:hypothetical protein
MGSIGSGGLVDGALCFLAGAFTAVGAALPLHIKIRTCVTCAVALLRFDVSGVCEMC